MMASKSQYSEWWNLIRQSPSDRLSDYRAPLIGLSDVADHFGLEPIPDVSVDASRLSAELPIKPLFKNLTADTLPVLRYKLAQDTDTDNVASWAERVLRYCEIWRHDLKKRMESKWSSPAEAARSALQIAAFMLDIYETTGDLRYLNLALKIRDMEWVATPQNILNGLRSANQDDFVAALFGVRVYLMCERAVARLEGSAQ